MLNKIMRIVSIILLALTALAALMGGVGSTCLAFRTQDYAAQDPAKWGPLVPFAWLYQLLVVLTIGAALWAGFETYRLLRARPNAYRQALWALLACLTLAGVQMTASRLLRGSSQPNDMRVYLSALTLLIFLAWRMTGGSPSHTPGSTLKSGGALTGLLLMLLGAAGLSAPGWVGASHLSNGIDYAQAFNWPLSVLGGALLAGGTLLLAASLRPLISTGSACPPAAAPPQHRPDMPG